MEFKENIKQLIGDMWSVQPAQIKYDNQQKSKVIAEVDGQNATLYMSFDNAFFDKETGVVYGEFHLPPEGTYFTMGNNQHHPQILKYNPLTCSILLVFCQMLFVYCSKDHIL